MCDYSLHSVKTRPAVVGETLVTTDFGTGTRGFAAAGDPKTAVCLLPGTELAFDSNIEQSSWGMFSQGSKTVPYKLARFRQINTAEQRTHHDALEFVDGSQVLLTALVCGQEAKVLQLPAAPRNESEAKAHERFLT
jgi:hypothetical protein